jgi:hypothetical protein
MNGGTTGHTGHSPGLCGSCLHARRITSSKGSIFIRCELSFSDPRFSRYPALPVLHCPGYAPGATTSLAREDGSED